MPLARATPWRWTCASAFAVGAGLVWLSSCAGLTGLSDGPGGSLPNQEDGARLASPPSPEGGSNLDSPLGTTCTADGAAQIGDGCAPSPKTGLIAHYTFEEGGGVTVVDRAGDNNGTHNASYAAGVHGGTGLLLNAATGVTIPGGNAFSWGGANQDYTVEYWLRLDATNTVWASVFQKTDTTGQNKLVRTPGLFFLEAQVAPIMGTTSDSNEYNGFTPNTFVLGQWTHFAAVHSGSQEIIYIDGAVVATWTLSSATLGSAGVLYLGANPWYPGFVGAMDEVRIYGRALSAAEIAADM